MVMELRHVLFEPREVVEAVKDYYHKLGRILPHGVVSHCGPEADGANGRTSFRIVINEYAEGVDRLRGRTGPPTELVIEGAELAAALILHCRKNKVPLPAQAEKSLQMFGGQLCLLATMSRTKCLPSPGQPISL